MGFLRSWRLDIRAPDTILERFQEENERRENYGAKALILGLLIEFVFAFWFRDGKSFVRIWTPVLADVLVVGGVLIEVHFAARSGLIGNELRRRSNERLADANKLAAEAYERAANAEERASVADKVAQEARERTARVEARTQGRSLSHDAFDHLVNSIRALVPEPLNPVLEYTSSDPEAYNFAVEIGFAFSRAGIRRHLFLERDMAGKTCYNVFVADNPPGRGWKLMDAFAKGGPGAMLLNETNLLKWGGKALQSDLYVFVGCKPPHWSPNHADRMFASFREEGK